MLADLEACVNKFINSKDPQTIVTNLTDVIKPLRQGKPINKQVRRVTIDLTESEPINSRKKPKEKETIVLTDSIAYDVKFKPRIRRPVNSLNL